MDRKPYIKPGMTGSVDVSSPEFEQWFGKSAVVDKDGNPQRVYRAIWRDEETPTKGATGLSDDHQTAGFYYTPDPRCRGFPTDLPVVGWL